MKCLAKAVYHEARGEPELGQIAVAQVVLNRTKSDKYPKEICDVVYQPRQFSYILRAKPDETSDAWGTALEIALLTYSGKIDDPTNGALYFYNPDIAAGKPCRKCKVTASIGDHDFLI